MTYHLHIQAFREYYLFAVTEEDLMKALNVHDTGGASLSIPGEKVVQLDGFQCMRVYENKSGYTRDQCIGAMEQDAGGMGKRYWNSRLLKQLGEDVTRDVMKYGFGEKPKQGRSSALVTSSSGLDIWSLLHIKVEEVSRKLYEGEHYKQAVQAALTEVDSCVRVKYRSTQNDGKTGASMMARAFAKQNPVIQLFELTDPDQEIKQEGYMHIFMGVMMALRNPNSHSNFEIEERDAIEMLFIASRLLRKVDEALQS